MKVKLLTDSSCDLPEPLRLGMDLETLPLYVLQGERTYLDRIDINSEEIYRRMRQGEYFSTAQISYHDFYGIFAKAAIRGTPTVCLPISSGISGTYQTAVLAKNNIKEAYPDFPLAVVDTRSVVGGLGLFVYYLHQKIVSGADFEEVLAYADLLRPRIRHVFFGDDLNYFYRGGRLSRTSALMGNVLGIKPLLHVDENGTLQPLKNTRGKKKLLKAFLDYMEENNTGHDLKDQVVIICHADAPVLAERMKKAIEKKFGTEKIYLDFIAPVVGVHTGPGIIAVFFLTEMV